MYYRSLWFVIKLSNNDGAELCRAMHELFHANHDGGKNSCYFANTIEANSHGDGHDYNGDASQVVEVDAFK